jgi:glycosyltransferase involved in cell wall biosynthesis
MQTEMKKVAVLIPCYNEAQTICKVVNDYRQALGEWGGGGKC